jgi:chromate transporter
MYTITAFGGPSAHISIMLHHFVQKKRYISQEELYELNAFCQLLPGASSTQILTLIGYKRGGISLAIITLLIWILPACLLMGAFSFYFAHHSSADIQETAFKYITFMVIGFLSFAALTSLGVNARSLATRLVVCVSMIISFFFFKIPWIFPLLILLGGCVTNLSNKRIPNSTDTGYKKVKWRNIWIFIFVFLAAGYFSETARKQDWSNRKVFHVFESSYRFGSMVFGGGDVLLPVMLDQYVARPTDKRIEVNNPGAIKIQATDLMTGFGMVRVLPGPIFSVSAFTGGMALKDKGMYQQLAGVFAGVIGIFLPSALLVLFFFPMWTNLKKYVVVYRSLEGIRAVVTGFLFSTILFLIFQTNAIQGHPSIPMGALVSVGTVLILSFTRIPAPVIVLITVLLGFLV